MKLYGHDKQIAAFSAALGSGRMHHAWLLTGPKGIGKARFADVAARLLLPGAEAEALLDAGSHPDLLRLEPVQDEKTDKRARSIKVEQVRWLRSRLSQSTAMGGYRPVIIDSAEELEGKSSPNALLKSLEEPSPKTIFLLVSHSPGRLLPTIRSRCRTLVFSPLDDAAMTSVLADARPAIDPSRHAALIAGAGGVPALALANALLDMDTINQSLDQLATTGDPTNAVRSDLAQSLALKAAHPRYEAFLQRVPGFIAAAARRRHGAELERALDAWGRAQSLSEVAIPGSLIAESVVFEMAGYVAALAPVRRGAKA